MYPKVHILWPLYGLEYQRWSCRDQSASSEVVTWLVILFRLSTQQLRCIYAPRPPCGAQCWSRARQTVTWLTPRMRGAERGHVSSRALHPLDRRHLSPAVRMPFLLRSTVGIGSQSQAGHACRGNVPTARQLRPALPLRRECSNLSRPDVGATCPRRVGSVPSGLRPLSAPAHADLRVSRRPRPVLLPTVDGPTVRAGGLRRPVHQRPGHADGDPGSGRGPAVAGSFLPAERPPRQTSTSGSSGVDAYQLRQTGLRRVFHGLTAAVRQRESKDLSPELPVRPLK